MTKTFDDLVRELSPEDLEVVRGYIIQTVKIEFGALIENLSGQADVLTVQATGTMGALRSFARVMAAEE